MKVVSLIVHELKFLPTDDDDDNNNNNNNARGMVIVLLTHALCIATISWYNNIINDNIM